MLGGVLGDWDNSTGEYSYNTVIAGGRGSVGLLILQGGIAVPDNPSQFLIHHNSVATVGRNADGILVLDAGPLTGAGKRINATIADNKIGTAGAGAYAAFAGIELVYSEDAVVSNNRISGGNVVAGIVAESAIGCMLKANDLRQLQPLAAPIALLGVSSGLPWDTGTCTVVGGNSRTAVYDEGTTNTLVGVNNTTGNPPGPAIKTAMQEKRDMLKSRVR